MLFHFKNIIQLKIDHKMIYSSRFNKLKLEIILANSKMIKDRELADWLLEVNQKNLSIQLLKVNLKIILLMGMLDLFGQMEPIKKGHLIILFFQTNKNLLLYQENLMILKNNPK